MEKDVDMTSLDTYIEMIGKSIIYYCNRQLHANKKPEISDSILKIDLSAGLNTSDTLDKIEHLKVSLFGLIVSTLRKTNSSTQRQFHLLYFLDRYTYFLKGLVGSNAFTDEGWAEFANQLERFIDVCNRLYANSPTQVNIPYDDNVIIDKDNQPKRSEDGKYYDILLTGLNHLSGPKKGVDKSDLGKIVGNHLIKSGRDTSQLVHELIDNHRVHQQYQLNIERDRKIQQLEANYSELSADHDVLKESHETLKTALATLQEKFDEMTGYIKLLDETQKTLTILKRPAFFAPPAHPKTNENVEKTSVPEP